MLVFFYIFEIDAAGMTITVKTSTGGFRFDYAIYWDLTVKVVT